MMKNVKNVEGREQSFIMGQKRREGEKEKRLYEGYIMIQYFRM